MIGAAAALGRVPREAWYGLGAVVAIWAAYSWAYSRGADSVRADLQPRLDAAMHNIDLLDGAIANQSRLIESLRVDERKARQAVQNAARAGERVRGRIEPLVEPSRSVGPSGCDTAPEARALWEVM